ncbi:SRPBCC domain-containing protein [Pseudofrankia sp. BMG5.37]|uniref:SRPBCC family protein n=1 Tax=Pseudofrankia sp. BMG5.37 TaxID=3050035 RepID=UPI002894E3DE|nr:SRPBCC domain-containing protein [Pseudofrankia sp. BMG5.37]MDT3438051.1 SRPBCC domain-containing protein [Pseudofrankia sp. BMG5.37]
MVGIEESVEVSASPDEVWEWIATGPGLSAWFVAASVEPGAAGSVTLTFAPGASGTMPIVEWSPPWRFRFGAASGTSGRAHDFTVSATAGGCRVKLLDDGVAPEEAEQTALGWRGMLSRLAAVVEGGHERADGQP